MDQQIKNDLYQSIPPALIDELLKRHSLLKEKFLKSYFDSTNLENSELNAGKFGEIVLRILQYLTSGIYTQLGRKINFDYSLMQQFENTHDVPDSIRIHIPRSLRAVYDMRNRRGVGHISPDIDPNFMDASYLVSSCDWIMGELMRLYAKSNPQKVIGVINALIKKEVPILWLLDGKPLILDPRMGLQGKVLVYLYQIGGNGASVEAVKTLCSTKKNKIAGIITQLLKKCFILKSPKTHNYVLTPLGVDFVQKTIPLSVVN